MQTNKGPYGLGYATECVISALDNWVHGLRVRSSGPTGRELTAWEKNILYNAPLMAEKLRAELGEYRKRLAALSANL